jgi:hypothetical protein
MHEYFNKTIARFGGKKEEEGRKKLKIGSCKPEAFSVNVSYEPYLYRTRVGFISRDTDLSCDGRDRSCSKQQGIEISH